MQQKYLSAEQQTDLTVSTGRSAARTARSEPFGHSGLMRPTKLIAGPNGDAANRLAAHQRARVATVFPLSDSAGFVVATMSIDRISTSAPSRR